MNHGTIYSDVLQYCAPGQPPQLWRHMVDLQNDVHGQLEDERSVLAGLKRTHLLTDLIASGVVVRDAGQTIRMSDVLRNTCDSIIALRASPDGDPIDLLTDQGAVSRRLPLYVCAGDYLVRDR